MTLEKINKRILKLLTGLYPDMVTLNYLYGLRKAKEAQLRERTAKR